MVIIFAADAARCTVARFSDREGGRHLLPAVGVRHSGHAPGPGAALATDRAEAGLSAGGRQLQPRTEPLPGGAAGAGSRSGAGRLPPPR